jgi:hypothetical protein
MKQFKNTLSWGLLFLILLSLSCANRATKSFTIANQKSGKIHMISLQPGPEEGNDAFVEDYPDNNYRDRNFGNVPAFLAVSWTAAGTPLLVRSMIDFDLSNVPKGAEIFSAKLSLFAFNDSTGHGKGHSSLGGDNSCLIQRIISPWTEQTVTWNNQPSATLTNAVTLHQSDSIMQDFTEIDITNLVKDILRYKSSSFGLMLKIVTESGYRKMTFASSDAKNVNKRPRLEVYYRLK